MCACPEGELHELGLLGGFDVRELVLLGRAMAIVYDEASLDEYMRSAVDASPEKPILIDKFLEDAFEFDVDAVADATGAVLGTALCWAWGKIWRRSDV